VTFEEPEEVRTPDTVPVLPKRVKETSELEAPASVKAEQFGESPGLPESVSEMKPEVPVGSRIQQSTTQKKTLTKITGKQTPQIEEVGSWGRSHKTFYNCNLRIFVIS
jgi:hypothetical protein